MIQWESYPAKAFQEQAEAWQSLNRRTANTQLLHPSFVDALLTGFGEDKLWVVAGIKDGEWVAAGIFQKLAFGRWQTFQPSQAPIGCWLCRKDLFSDELLGSVADALPGFVLQLGITQIDPPMLPRPKSSSTIHTLDFITTGRLEVPRDFDAYWASRSKNVRQNVNKAGNRLAKEGVSYRFEVLSDSATIEGAVSDYGLLESAGWKSSDGTAVHPDNEQGRFYSRMIEAFSPDKAEVWRYLYDDKVVATDLCIHDGETLIILKTTFDESWKRYSPAFCMHIEGIRHCSDVGYKVIEFFGPAMEWHRKLTEELRTQYHLNWYRTSLLPASVRVLRSLRRRVA